MRGNDKARLHFPKAEERAVANALTFFFRNIAVIAASAAISKKTKGASATAVALSTPKQKVKVLTPGLTNLGNTCFFNSVVQVRIRITIDDKA